MSTLPDGSSQPSKLRYGGRGGAGSRPRSITPSSPKSHSLPQSTSPSSSTSLKGIPPPVPAIPTSSLAGRRGAPNLPAPLVLRALSPHNVPDLNTPPLSATTHTSSTPDSEYLNTPRTPYFYFDEAFDKSHDPQPSSPNTSGSMTRSLRRLASLTQGLFVKDRSLKAPPPTPTLPSPISSTHDSFPPPLTSPSETSITSEWYEATEGHCDDTPDTFEASVPHPDPLPAPIIVELPQSGGRGRSASSATVKPRRRKLPDERRQREPPRTQGEWNNDIGEVIVALRLLK
ncbi:hypothetical protein C8R45DRAFT_1215401 [Mycena sanguinolenta]|nr:hypothetical protein C8R45DRAFT_1215401 [Mycena sanguinolenta]